MWNQLYSDYRQRALHLGGLERCGNALCDCQPDNIIDETACWQLCGDEVLVGEEDLPAPVAGALALHLPEIYSGAPWSFQEAPPGWFPPALIGRWVAFVTTNPSIDTAAPFPTVADWEGPDDTDWIRSYFENRFASPPILEPLPHGRADLPRFAQQNGLCIWDGAGLPIPASKTWQNLEALLSDAVVAAGHGELPMLLGSVGTIIDAVPWKFKRWGSVDARRWRREDDFGRRVSRHSLLIEAGRPYLEWALHHSRAPLIVVTGDAVAAAHAVLGTPNEKVPFADHGDVALPGGGQARVVSTFQPSSWQFTPRAREPLLKFLTEWFA